MLRIRTPYGIAHVLYSTVLPGCPIGGSGSGFWTEPPANVECQSEGWRLAKAFPGGVCATMDIFRAYVGDKPPLALGSRVSPCAYRTCCLGGAHPLPSLRRGLNIGGYNITCRYPTAPLACKEGLFRDEGKRFRPQKDTRRSGLLCRWCDNPMVR